MMTRLFHAALPIAVETDATGDPVQFLWEQRLHRITTIVQVWHVDSEWWASQGYAARAYFAVTTATGLLCVIYQDLLTDEWFLSSLYD